MSMKRQATTELNHDNWNEEESEEPEEMGMFKTASKEILEKRVIRTAKRRTQVSSDEPKKSVFSGFGGFNKTQTSSFDFLANLTNGNKNANGLSTKSDPVTSSLFTSNMTQKSPTVNFGTPPPPVKSVFSTTPSSTSSIFGSSNNVTSPVFSLKTDTTVKDNPFKIPTIPNTGETMNKEITKVTNASTTVTTPQETSSIFGTPSATTSNKSGPSSTNTAPSKTQPISMDANVDKRTTENKSEEKKMQYYCKLRGLNKSVSDWIKKHVEETPLCILTPIFRDYDKYLKEMQAELESPEKNQKNDETQMKTITESVKMKDNSTSPKTDSVPTTSNNTLLGGSSLFKTEDSKQSLFAANTNNASLQKTTGFSFGIQNSSTNIPPAVVTTSAGFSFGIKPTSVSSQSSTTITSTPSDGSTISTQFSFKPNTNTSTNSTGPFSFGIGKPYSFGTNVNSKAENTETKTEGNEGQDDDDTPPKVEFTPIPEENSVFDKRCKIFVKKNDNFADRGIGTLYIKKIENSDSYQLLVRANTSLGNVLLNLRLSSSIPTQRMGKNNVMIVCIPTPESKPPPTPILIRVKTSEEADELLEVLNKFKK